MVAARRRRRSRGPESVTRYYTTHVYSGHHAPRLCAPTQVVMELVGCSQMYMTARYQPIPPEHVTSIAKQIETLRRRTERGHN
jgi:hypothetical protein